MGAVQLVGINKSFGTAKVIDDVSLDIRDGEFIVFVGPSGCGKSTLLRLISGLEEPTSGRVLIAGQDVTQAAPAERQISMVFQSYALYPHMSVRDNIGFGLRIAGFSREETRTRVDEAARMLELTPLLDRRPRDLSGGQRQRVAIGRAIVRSPQAFLFDEPLSNLDAALRVQMRMEIIGLHQSLGRTMIYVTHDQVEAMTMADRIVVLRSGRVEQFDTPITLYDRPANRFVAGFIGSPRMNFIPVSLSEGELIDAGGGRIRVEGRSPDEMRRATVLGVRPEHLTYGSEGGVWSGRIRVLEQLGSDAFLHVTVDGLEAPLVVRASGERRLREGEVVSLSPRPGTVHLFDQDDHAIGAPDPAFRPSRAA
ncbi:ABC transporter ATP-binding protein [Rubellimicrobium arenae]|uniref:ABC transporter ATP-binding protein n=1 Tax=Rubellimicrobium arenae TaxID=2817372 RepID=UPI001B30063A|nr:sn-glycerol-3-phosphate ABC transporter ATP-binding protein UgpC [Rubellimicrobium arenae]